MVNRKQRWIFSPLEDVPLPDGKTVQLPSCREYALAWAAPMHIGTHALVFCEMDLTQLRAAKADPRLIVCESIHHDDSIHNSIADHHAHLGAKRGMKLRDLLRTLAQTEPMFDLEK